MSSDDNKNSIAWQTICDALNIPEIVDIEGEYHIESTTMKKLSNREARHLGKIDNSSQLPEVFRKNKLNILPESRRSYVIGHFNLFENLDYENVKVIHAPIIRKFDTLSMGGRFTHETSAITATFNCGILDKIAGNPSPPLSLARSGRSSTGIWDFRVNNTTIHVRNAQLEMDGVFESEDNIVNIEAKIGTKGDFIKRQLFYPYRYLRTMTDKPIINTFLTASGGSIYTHLYEVTDDYEYNSLKKTAAYRFDLFDPYKEQSIQSIIRNTQIIDEPKGIPFPQADSISKVFDTLEFIAKKPGAADVNIADMLAIEPRQGGYYGNACAYLGLFERYRVPGHGNTKFNRLTAAGEEYISMDSAHRNMFIIRLMARHKVFNICLTDILDGKPLPKEYIVELIDKYAINMSKGTPDRRAGTVSGWCNWVKSILD